MTFKLSCVVLVLSMVFLSTEAKNESITQYDFTGDYEEYVTASVKDGCLGKRLKDRMKSGKTLKGIQIPPLRWIQTPSIVEVGPGHYQALGRVIHLKYLKEQLATQKNFDFNAKRKTMNLVTQLDILADTLYLEGTIYIYGISHIKIYVREIRATYESHVYFSAPNWNQEYKTRIVAGRNGEDGKNGIDGPRVDIVCDVINGVFEITSKAGNGHKGQDGGNGQTARGSGRTKPDKPRSVCDVDWDDCPGYVHGVRGEKGPTGGNGGNAGKPGNGGKAGLVTFRARKIIGQIGLDTCKGTGAKPAKNGRGGRGGAGGLGGRGRLCRVFYDRCVGLDAGHRAPRGPPGSAGRPGTTPNIPGKDGIIYKTHVVAGFKWTLDETSKRSYPIELINIIRRQAEDLLIGNKNDKMGRNALKFVLRLARKRNDLEDMKKDVKRKLGFLGKEGYDIFGKNKLFAPRMKWQALEDTIEDIKSAAESYEKAFNDVISAIKNDQNFQQVASKMSAVTSLQVNAEKKRLEEAKLIAESQKRVYVKSIRQLEEQMTSILENIKIVLSDVYAHAQFTGRDFLVVLQGLVGFSSAAVSKNPLGVVDTAVGQAGSFAGKGCLKSLQSVLGSVKKWLTFGEHYKPLIDSSDLDFDLLDVGSVPQIMQANLEMNKEKFTAELVCLLEVTAVPPNVAEFKQLMESFFIAGAARIDLIAEIMNLDNDIGGYNFDIPLLQQTEKAIKDATAAKGAPITKKLQQTFMENLLGTYRELERSFMRNLYELHKAFTFRTLWEGSNPLASFRRVTSESARGTGRLNGGVQLTRLLRQTKELVDKANKCFTYNKYTTDIHKWSFDSVKDKRIFQDLASKGHTRFSIDIDQSCKTCYNVRLLKMYIELFGKEAQPDSIPRKVYLDVRHLSGSFFQAGDKTIKQFYQPVGSFRNIKFDRFTLSNEKKCKRRKEKGKKSGSFCVTKDDSRWEPMCNHALNSRRSHGKDTLLGMEECQSPFGIYELKIPVDTNLACDASGIRNTNCKDLDLTKFTQMNVWTHYIYWPGQYPTGPDDIICRKNQRKKRNETEAIVQEFHASTDIVEDKF